MPLTEAELAAMRERAAKRWSCLCRPNTPGCGCPCHVADGVLLLVDTVESLQLDNEALRVEVEQQRLDTTTGTDDCYAGQCQHKFCATVRGNAKREANRLRQRIADMAEVCREIANNIDGWFPNDQEPEAQTDLRRLADKLEADLKAPQADAAGGEAKGDG